jgi:hypothetical protein
MSIEEMKAELEAAGYERFSKFHDKPLTLKHPYEPDMMLWNNGLFFHSVSQAHEHMEKERRFKAMEAFIEKVSKTETIDEIFHQGENGSMMYSEHPKLKALVEEAKNLIEVED